MSVRVLAGVYDNDETKACFVDSTTERAFGPLMDSETEADEFLEWLGKYHNGTDPRDISFEQLDTLLEVYREDSDSI